MVLGVNQLDQAPQRAVKVLEAIKHGVQIAPPGDPSRGDVALPDGHARRPERMAQRDLRAAAELDWNGVIVTPSGVLVVDARVRIAAAAPGRPLRGRR